MAQNGKSLLACSHTVELSEKWGRRIRGLLVEYAPVLGAGLSSESQAAGRFQLDNGAEYLAAGVNSAIVGFRASGGVIIDDPVASAESAASESIREKTFEWYRTECSTRLTPGAFTILVSTRWHEDDLAGRLLQEEGDDWEVLSLPAQAEDDTWLWDDDSGFPYGELMRQQKKSQSARNWSSLFQQNPTPDEGTYFLAEWFKPYAPHELPDLKTLSVFGASDYAVSEGKGDYTCHVVVGIDPEDRMFLLDLWRGQKSPDVWIDALCDLILKWKPQGWAEEQGQIKSAIGPFLDTRMNARRAYVARAKFPTKYYKSIRAQSIRGRMAVKGLYVPTGASWHPDFHSELLSFPAGKHDDAVDAMALIGQVLDKMWVGSPLVTEKPRPKIISTDPSQCTVTMNDLWRENERHSKRRRSLRIS